MTVPTLILDVEYGLTVRRGNRVRRVQFGNGLEQVIPDGINNEIRKYDVRTVPITDEQAAVLDETLASIQGDHFLARFFQDDQIYKYRLDPNEWSWESLGPNSNIISFSCKRIY